MATVKINTEMSPDTATRIFAWASAVADIVINAPGDRKLRLGDLTQAGVHYVADYGVSQSMTDVHSGMAKKVKDAAELATADKPDSKPWDKLTAEAGLSMMQPTEKGIEEVANAIINVRQQKRFDAIVASSLPVREVGGRLSGKDAWVAKAALDEIKAKHDAAGKDMPKGQALRDLTARYVAAKSLYFTGLYDAHVARLQGAAANADEILGF